MSDNIVDNLENDYHKLNDDNNFDINIDNNLFDDTKNESPKFLTSTNDWDMANTCVHYNLPISQ